MTFTIPLPSHDFIVGFLVGGTVAALVAVGGVAWLINQMIPRVWR